MSNKEKIIFVYLGDLPDYALYSIEIALKYHDVILLIDSNTEVNINNVEIVNIKSFYPGSVYHLWMEAINKRVDSKTLNFRDGFWIKTIERFFVLGAYLQKMQLNKVFHGEIDNLFFNLVSIVEYSKKDNKFIYFPVQSESSGAGSIIYINDYKGIEELCYFICKQNSFFTDMQLLGIFAKKYPSSVGILPAELNLCIGDYIKYKDENFITDSAGIGQFIFGIDPRNTGKPLFNRFRNENSGVEISKYKFSIAEDFSSCSLQKNNIKINLCNLHIHSKVHKKLVLSNSFMKKVIRRINRNQSTLIYWNIKNLKFLRNILTMF